MKAGDKVVLLANVYDSPDDNDMAPGRTGVVTGLSVDNLYIHVDLDIPVEGEKNWTFLPSELELVK